MERSGGDRLFPFGKAILESEVCIEKMPARPQHPRDLRQETRERRITVGRFDIDYQVEGVFFKRQMFGIALEENQTIGLVPPPAKSDPGGIQIQSGVMLRRKGSRKIGGSATVAATYFQDTFSPPRHLRGDVMIKLDAGAVGFVSGP